MEEIQPPPRVSRRPDSEASGGLKVGQGAIWALSDLTMERRSRVAERWNATPGHSGPTEHEGDSTPRAGDGGYQAMR